MDPRLCKNVTVKRGLTYRYYYSPPADSGKPTLFFIHGFPSSSVEWARQVVHFQPRGYGVLVPDCLGYGGTDRPEDVESYRCNLKALAEDLMDVLEAVDPSGNVLGIAHDWGCILLSNLAQYHQDRFAGLVWISVAHASIPAVDPPNDLEGYFAEMRVQTGGDLFGYWTFFNADDAPAIAEENIDSFLQLLYPSPPELWTEWMNPRGKLREWIESNNTPGRAPWMTPEEYATIRDKLLEGGMRGPMNYYKAWIRGTNLQDMKELPEENMKITKPALFVATTRDYVCLADLGKESMLRYAPHADIVDIDCGHWAQMEATEQLNNVLEAWIGSKCN